MDASQDARVSQNIAAASRVAGPSRAAGLLSARSTVVAVLAAAGAAAITFGVHLPVLGHYFYGDDFVPLGEVASSGSGEYLRNLVLLDDITPNWRLLPGLFYLTLYRAAGLNALPFLLANVLVHTATAALIFLFVRRVTGITWAGLLAGALFGVSAAYEPTVSQVTAFNNVLAGLFVMLSLVLLLEGLLRRTHLVWWVAGSTAAFMGAIASNESTAMLAAIPVMLVAWKAFDETGHWQNPAAWVRAMPLAAPYAVAGGAALVGFGACQCTEAASVYEGGDHVVGNLWIYLGRLLYPVGLEFPGDAGTAHLVAALVVVGLAAIMLVRGPGLARICVAFLGLAVLPYLPVHFALASRYVYLAAIPFSILAALLFVEVSGYMRRVSPPAGLLLVVAAAAAIGLHGWQTVDQNRFIADESAEWRELVDGLERRLPDLPEGSRVIVRGGPLAEPLWQFFVLPAVGETVWGGVDLYSVSEEQVRFCAPPGGELYVLDYDAANFTPAPIRPAVDSPGPPAGGAVVVECETPAVLP